MALFSFLKIIAKINKYSHILEYRKEPGLQARIDDYKVEMGFGLHQGWAIEGAIGSFFKIDASYLSPNVNMSSRLQAASKQYGVYILISHLFYFVLTPEVRQICREIDRITVKGSNQPIRIFTVEMDINGLEETNDRFNKQTTKEKKRNYEKEK
jgi:class 3 adenylate cyclase